VNAVRWLLLIPVLVTIAGLATGANWLVQPTPGWPALPLGNLATWTALVLLGVLLLLQAARLRRGVFKRAAAGLLAMACAWGPIGYFASGNWRFSFTNSDNALGSWWLFTGLLAGSLLLGLALSLLPAPRDASPGPRA
jgi:hypothetical protein